MSIFVNAHRLVMLGGLLLVPVFAQQAQVPFTSAKLRTTLVKYAGYSEADLAAMDRGEIVVKAVKTANKQDIAIFGIVRNTNLPRISMEAFRDSLSQKANKEIGAKGRFSEPPQLADLAEFELEDRDIEDLRKCTAGNCDINLSKEWIERFNTDIAPNSTDHRQRATELFRTMLLEYLLRYRSGGIASLGTLSNRNKPFDLRLAHAELLKDLPLIDDLGGLRQYMEGFPAADSARIQNEFYWSSMEFGLDPTVVLTHTALFSGDASGDEPQVIVTRQFYSTKYLDASISLAALIRIPAGETTESYIIFADRSRSDALGGILGGVARGVVEKEAVTRVANVLKTAELRLMSGPAHQSEQRSENRETSDVSGNIVNMRIIVIAAVAVAAILVIFAVILDRRRKRRA